MKPRLAAEEVEVEEYATRARFVSGSTPMAYGRGAGETCPCKAPERSTVVVEVTGQEEPGMGRMETLWLP